MAGLLFAHVFAYMVFHPVKNWLYFPALGVLAATAFTDPGSGITGWLTLFAGFAIGGVVQVLMRQYAESAAEMNPVAEDMFNRMCLDFLQNG